MRLTPAKGTPFGAAVQSKNRRLASYLRGTDVVLQLFDEPLNQRDSDAPLDADMRRALAKRSSGSLKLAEPKPRTLPAQACG
jgi:hypothetical protein